MTAKTITFWLAVNELGEHYIDYAGETTAADAIDGLQCDSGFQAVRAIQINVTLDLPTVEEIDVVVPQSQSPAEVTVS